ncbi:MAG TPA: response regulator transcription factor [Candidatus Limnocylindrales bacterium]|nr:response regulator transcription factor [Candidatus Limnocylindrales bacterium]
MGPSAGAPGTRPAHSGVLGQIRIALVDDHHLIREGLRLVLQGEPGFEIVGEAEDHASAVELVVSERPDVLLLDLTFPEGDALPLLRALRTRQPDLRVIVLTMHSDPETVRQALAAGAAGYLVKGARSRELMEAIRAVARGDRYLHSSVTGAIVEDSIRWFEAGTISVREREVLSLLAAGQSPTQIARSLDISVHTVRRHLANTSEKLGVKGINALTRYAIRHGFDRAGS